ncbi:MAG: hypothetical protein JXO22_08845 [Phycisphaerae bacterium]|nr:hypothetical protein [Phycisphaerae bacterium]
MTAQSKLRNRLVVFAAILMGACAVASGAGVDDFTLTRAIPADAFMVVHGRDHDGLAFLNKQYERVWEKLESARLDRELKRLLKTVNKESGGDPDEFESWWVELNDLLVGVEWASLTKQEMSFAMRIGFPTPEMLMLMRPPAEQVAADYKGLSTMLSKLAAKDPSLAVTETGEGESVVCQLSLGGPMPVVLTISRQKDVLLVGFGTTLVEQSLALLKGEAKGTLAETARFRAAFDSLPKPGEELAFIDFDRLMNQIRQYMTSVEAMMEESGGDKEGIEMAGKVIDACDMLDYMASVSTTDGLRTAEQSVVALREDAKSKPFYAGIFGKGALKQPLNFIPKDATNVTVTSGMDFLKLYQAILGFVSDNVPDGADMVAQFKTDMEAAEFDIEKDLLGWLDGGLAMFGMPGATSFSPEDWAVLIRVTDKAKAGEMVGKLLEAVTPMISQQQGQIADVPIEGCEGFKTIELPMLAMFGMKPTIGVTDDFLIVASSAKVISAALEAGKGGDTFAKNERFLKEGLPLEKGIVSFSFSDTSKTGEQLSQALGMAPMIGMIGGAELQQQPLVMALLRVMGRLGPVASELNFYLSSCSQTTFDGTRYVTKKVNNYREPPKPAAASAPAEKSEDEGTDEEDSPE